MVYHNLRKFIGSTQVCFFFYLSIVFILAHSTVPVIYIILTARFSCPVINWWFSLHARAFFATMSINITAFVLLQLGKTFLMRTTVLGDKGVKHWASSNFQEEGECREKLPGLDPAAELSKVYSMMNIKCTLVSKSAMQCKKMHRYFVSSLFKNHGFCHFLFKQL